MALLGDIQARDQILQNSQAYKNVFVCLCACAGDSPVSMVKYERAPLLVLMLTLLILSLLKIDVVFEKRQ